MNHDGLAGGGVQSGRRSRLCTRVISRAAELRARHEGEAAIRRQIDKLMAAPVPVHTPALPRVRVREAA